MSLIQPATTGFVNNFSMSQFKNVTDVLTADTNNLYVASEECKRFVIQNCYASTKFYMHTSIALILLLFIVLFLLRKKNNKIQDLEEELKKC